MDQAESLSRRRFIQYGVGGLTGMAVGSLQERASQVVAAQAPAARTINLSFEEALVEMVDATRVYHWLFKLQGDPLPSFPGPVFFATAGDTITVNLRNNLNEAHAFQVLGVPGSASGSIPAGGRRTVRFTLPQAGTFLYCDPSNAPVSRVMGLHGAWVVLPRNVREETAVNTPYNNLPPNSNVQRLFDDLGSSPHFPGDPWIPVRPADKLPNADLHVPADIEPFLYRTRIWLFTQVDPELNARVQALRPGALFNPLAFERQFLPRYFLINGQSGAFPAHDHATKIEGFIGEPFVVRLLNAGLATISPHLHGNHFYLTAINAAAQESVATLDAMSITTVQPQAGRPFFSGASTVDWLVALMRPEDIPGNPATPLRDLIPEELALVIGDVPQSPLKYPMHNHTEQSQTAAGGNYPQGDITDLIFLGDVDKVCFPGSPCSGSGTNRSRGRN
jgi:hypothetical protein